MKVKNVMRGFVFVAASFIAFAASAQDDIQDLANQWTAAYNSFDEDALSGLYTENAHLYLHGEPMIVGREAIKSFWANDFTIDNPLTTLTVTHSVLGFDMMLVHGNYQVLSRGTGEVLGAGRFAHIWHQVGDEWLLDQDLWNQPWD